MPQVLDIQAFLAGSEPILDTRSPAEYQQGHIPIACNLPLFTNAERAAVGVCYKQQGRIAAIELGLEFVGPKLATLVHQAKQHAPDRRVRLHCWRGGMRSSSLAWLLETAGFKVKLLQGGYKTFRTWVRALIAQPKPIHIVGGMTGSGKTEVLSELAALGQQILDLEGLANHRGSSFGHLGLPAQPSTEQFENLIACQWWQFDPQRPVWLEAESAQVGRCRIPRELFQQMEQAPIFEIVCSRQERIKRLAQLYGQAQTDALVVATERIRKRLGGLRTQQAIAKIQTGELEAAVAIILDYYDKTYRYDLDRREVERSTLEVQGQSATAVAQQLSQLGNQTLASNLGA